MGYATVAEAILTLILCSKAALTDSPGPGNAFESFLQQGQDPEPNAETMQNVTDVLLYIDDKDGKEQVAVDFNDAVEYARERLISEEPNSVDSEPFMTGDQYDNGRTDSSKLRIRTVDSDVSAVNWGDIEMGDSIEARYRLSLNRSGYDFDDWEAYTDFERAYLFDPGDVTQVPLDSDETIVVESTDRTQLTDVRLIGSANRVIGDRYEYTDTDDVVVLFSDDGYRDVRGDLDDSDRSDEDRLTIRRETAPNYDGSIPVSVLRTGFDRSVSDVDDYVLVGSDLGEVFSVEKDELSIIRTAEIPYSPPMSLSTGGRLSSTDFEGVPILYSKDSGTKMTGDRFSNSRTDADRLEVVQQSPSVAQAQTVPSTFRDVETIDIDDIDAVDMKIRAQFHEHPEKLSVEPTVPFYIGVNSEMMVGDMYANGLTDRSKLDVRQVTHRPQIDVDEVEAETPPPPIVLTPVLIIEERPIPVVPDIDELLSLPSDSSSPYMIGDLYASEETSRLLITALRRPVPQPSPPRVEEIITSDETEPWKYSFDLDASYTPPPPHHKKTRPESEQLTRYFENKKYKKDMNIAAQMQGERRAFNDKDGIPVFYSSDSGAYIGGDMFDNQRTDVTKLRIVLSSGTELTWGALESQSSESAVSASSNPGFLS